MGSAIFLRSTQLRLFPKGSHVVHPRQAPKCPQRDTLCILYPPTSPQTGVITTPPPPPPLRFSPDNLLVGHRAAACLNSPPPGVGGCVEGTNREHKPSLSHTLAIPFLIRQAVRS